MENSRANDLSGTQSLTLEDVARLAGVSRSTVSRVINHSPKVSDEVRQRVMAVIDETGYRPHAAARSLASQRSQILGFVIPRRVHTFFTDPYFPALTEGIAQACNKHSYTLSLFLFYTEEDEHKLFPTITRRGLLDGVIIQSTHAADEMFDQLARSAIPTIVAGRPMQADHFSFVDVDNVGGAVMAVRHLAHLGRRRIATISGPLETTVGLDRLEGYQTGLRESRLPYDNDLVVEGDLSESSGYYGARKLMLAEPDAIFAASDIMAVGAMRAIQETGRRIPQDISIIGFDDLPPAARTTPALSTIRQPIRRMGVDLVEKLLDIIESGPRPPRRVVFDTELVIRGTCGARNY